MKWIPWELLLVFLAQGLIARALLGGNPEPRDKKVLDSEDRGGHTPITTGDTEPSGRDPGGPQEGT